MKIIKTFVPLIKGIDLSLRKLPMIHIDSTNPGPTLWVTAAIHGDEVTGISIIHSLLSKLQRYPLNNGQIYCFPIMNPAGFETISRQEPYEASDLNRQFPGDPAGIMPERLAYAIGQTIIRTRPSYVIDLHTDSNNSIAYSILDKVPQNPITTKKAIALAQTLSFPWAVDVIRSDYDPAKTLSGYLMSNNIPSITMEMGGPMVVNEYFRKKGLESVWKVIQALNMVPSKIEVSMDTSLPQKVNVFAKRLECSQTGIIDYRIRPGEKFAGGQIMGKIRNVYGKEIEVIRAPEDGMLFSHEDQSIAFPGQSLFTFVKSVSSREIFKEAFDTLTNGE